MKTAGINVGIIGAAGYTAGELLRLLINHTEVKNIYCQSSSQVGKPVTTVHKDLVGEMSQSFIGEIDFGLVDVLFLCKGHGESKKFLEANEVPELVKIIDLSHDFRLAAEGNDFVYGLPEMNKVKIQDAQKIANPGCFATAIQ